MINKENIIKFAQNIGFSKIHREKLEKLEGCVRVLKDTLSNRKPLIDRKRILSLRKGGATIREIGKLLNLSSSSEHRALKKK